MQILGDRGGDFDLMRIARGAVRRYHHGSRRRAGWNARHQKIVGADDHRALDISKAHLRPAQFVGSKALAHDANFTAGQSGAGMHRLNVRMAIDVLLAQQIGRKFPWTPAS